MVGLLSQMIIKTTKRINRIISAASTSGIVMEKLNAIAPQVLVEFPIDNLRAPNWTIRIMGMITSGSTKKAFRIPKDFHWLISSERIRDAYPENKT